MPFQISELVIRVTGESPEGAVVGKNDPPPAISECRKGGHTCIPDGTNCRHGGTTCQNISECRKGGTTCMADDPPSTCRHGGTTCMPPGKSQPKKAELDFVLQQVRDAIAAEPANDEELVTA
jgi:hypothetical protein